LSGPASVAGTLTAPATGHTDVIERTVGQHPKISESFVKGGVTPDTFDESVDIHPRPHDNLRKGYHRATGIHRIANLCGGGKSHDHTYHCNEDPEKKSSLMHGR
jgi:hypothetical protein